MFPLFGPVSGEFHNQYAELVSGCCFHSTSASTNTNTSKQNINSINSQHVIYVCRRPSVGGAVGGGQIANFICEPFTGKYNRNTCGREWVWVNQSVACVMSSLPNIPLGYRRLVFVCVLLTEWGLIFQFLHFVFDCQVWYPRFPVKFPSLTVYIYICQKFATSPTLKRKYIIYILNQHHSTSYVCLSVHPSVLAYIAARCN